MTRNTRTLLVGTLLALALVAPAPARAAGFLIYDLSAEALAKASAVSASTTEPAAAWFNPAAVAFQEGYAVSLAGTYVNSSSSFQPAGSADKINSKAGNFFLPALFATGRFNKTFSASFGLVTPFGLGIQWPDGWMGQEYGLKASIQTVFLNPNFSVRLTPQLSLAAGLDVVRGTVDMTNGLPDYIGGGTVRIGGGTWGVGGNAAFLFRPLPNKLHLALSYRSRVKLSFDGKADFTANEPVFANQPSLQDQGGKAVITLPDIITFGAMFKPHKSLELTADVNVVLWNTYDELNLDFDTAPDETLYRNNHAAVTARVGVDWAAPVEGLHLRCGFIYDQNPAPKDYLSPTLPDANRVDFGVGVGYETHGFKVDVGYLLVWFLKSEATTGAATGPEGPAGTYKTIAHLMGLTLSYRFGASKPAPAPAVAMAD